MKDKSMRVSPLRIALDIVGIAIWTSAGLAFCVIVLVDQDTSKVALFIGIIPLFFTWIATRDFFRHRRARRITIQDQGVEVNGPRVLRVIKWKDIKSIIEKRTFSGGLILHGSDPKDEVFIPRAVEGYDDIRNNILQRTRIQPNK